MIGPLRFEPILKRLIWGGRRLGTVLGKPIGEGSDFAESWELADHRDDVSRVAEGPFRGQSLRELIASHHDELLGPGLRAVEAFPLLVKFLDARDVLSVQVHPDDALAARLSNDRGKTEAWVVVEAEPGSVLYAGFEPGVDRAAFEAALAAGDVEPLLHRVEPGPGDCILIPAGTVHAIGAGILLAEVQQMSDATYRVHDWGRLGPDSRPRALHLDEARQAIDFDRGPVDPVVPVVREVEGGTVERLAESPYFVLDRLRLAGRMTVGQPDRFTILMGLEGSGRLLGQGTAHSLARGQTLLLPASAGRCALEGEPGTAVLACAVP